MCFARVGPCPRICWLQAVEVWIKVHGLSVDAKDEYGYTPLVSCLLVLFLPLPPSSHSHTRMHLHVVHFSVWLLCRACTLQAFPTPLSKPSLALPHQKAILRVDTVSQFVARYTFTLCVCILRVFHLLLVQMVPDITGPARSLQTPFFLLAHSHSCLNATMP